MGYLVVWGLWFIVQVIHHGLIGHTGCVDLKGTHTAHIQYIKLAVTDPFLFSKRKQSLVQAARIFCSSFWPIIRGPNVATGLVPKGSKPHWRFFGPESLLDKRIKLSFRPKYPKLYVGLGRATDVRNVIRVLVLGSLCNYRHPVSQRE